MSSIGSEDYLERICEALVVYPNTPYSSKMRITLSDLSKLIRHAQTQQGISSVTKLATLLNRNKETYAKVIRGKSRYKGLHRDVIIELLDACLNPHKLSTKRSG